MSKNWVRSLREFRDFLSYVAFYAPDEFPPEDYLGPDEQMSLERAFAELERGLTLLDGSLADASMMDRLRTMIRESHLAFERGDTTKGAHLLQELQREIF